MSVDPRVMKGIKAFKPYVFFCGTYAILSSIPLLANTGCSMAATEHEARKLRLCLMIDSFPRGDVTFCKPPRSTHRWRLSSFLLPLSLSVYVLPGRAVHPAPENICAAPRRKCKISYKGQLWDLAYFPRGFLLFCRTFCFWRTGLDSMPVHHRARCDPFCAKLQVKACVGIVLHPTLED